MKHECPRCGLESGRDTWAHDHPVATVFIALPSLYTLTGVILAYPWFFVPLLVITAALWVDRRNRQRSAIAARADHEHRRIIAGAVFRPRPARARGADHWSDTQPMRAGRR